MKRVGDKMAKPVRQRSWRWPAMLLATLAGAVGVFQWNLWHPRVDQVDQADAILVLAYRADRQVHGRELAAAGVSENLVVNVSDRVRRLEDPNDPLTYEEGEWFEECGADYPDYHAYCIYPEPNTTAGEVAAFVRLAREQGWESVVVVTEPSHLGRARAILDRCFPGTVFASASSPDSSAGRNLWRSAYEMAAYVKDIVLPGPC